MRKRQLRTAVLLLILAAGMISAGIYARIAQWKPFSPAPLAQSVSAEVSPVAQQVSVAVQRYDRLEDGETAVLRDTATDGIPQKAELVILGMAPEAAMRRLLSELALSGVSAVFYATGSDAAQYPASLALVRSEGYEVGVAYLVSGQIEQVSGKRIVSELFPACAAVQVASGVWPDRLLTLTEPGEGLLDAAYACSMREAVQPTRVITLEEAYTEAMAQSLVDGLTRGSILCLRLDGAQAPDITPLVNALAQTNLQSIAQQMLEADYTPAQPQARAYTVERAVAFSFSGFGNRDELTSVLASLKAVKATATFFVTREEISRYPEDIRALVEAGHQLGISAQAARFTTAATMLEDLLYAKDELASAFSYTGDLAVRVAYGSVTDALRQACGAGGFTLVSSLVNVVRSDDIRMTDARAVLPLALPETNGVLQRGAIVHFQMKQYQRSSTLLGDLVRLVATERNIYSIKPVMDILNNREMTYTYPVPEESILPDLRDAIHPGQLTGNAMSAIVARYIGIDWVNSTSFLPGFTRAEIKRLDKKGLVANDENMVFLTFDDWGTDKAITALLDVLKAHNARATFFVRTENVTYNPNLLRAIAAEGHAVGSHTHTHFPLSNDTGDGKKFTELSAKQVEDLKKDLVTSHGVFESIIGDMTVNGRPALSLLFRPPTLAVSKNGMEAVLDCGFTHVVSGSYTTQDYKATSASSLAETLKKRTKSGAVLIMHMSDNSIYTAEALDIYLSEMELRDADKRYKFAGLDEVLQ